MNELMYSKIRLWFLSKNIRFKVFVILHNYLPKIVFLTYFVLLSWLAFNRDLRIVKVTLIPLVIFLFVSVLRKIINKPRPHIVLNIEPLIKKEKDGESFPSRHVLSVSIIAMACFYINPYIGIEMTVITVLIAIIRVLSGVHFIKDVVFGALISYIIGGALFWLI